MRRECDAVSGDVYPGTAADGRGGKDWSSYRPLLETCTDQTARQAGTTVMPLLNTGAAAQWAAELPVTRCPKVVTALQRALALGLVQPQVPACSFSCFTTAATSPVASGLPMTAYACSTKRKTSPTPWFPVSTCSSYRLWTVRCA